MHRVRRPSGLQTNAGMFLVDRAALAAQPGMLTGTLAKNGQASGATVQDSLTNAGAEISARQIVNTAGQWIAAAEPGRAWCRLSKGIHLVMPAIPADGALLLTARSDGRHDQMD